MSISCRLSSSTDEEAEFYRRKLEDFRWSLKVRSKGVSFVAVALREMDESLQDIDMTPSPVGRSQRASLKQSVDMSHASSTSSTGLPATDAETQTSGSSSELQQVHVPFQPSSYPGHDQFSAGSPGFTMLDLEAASSSHGYFSDATGTENGFFYPGIA